MSKYLHLRAVSLRMQGAEASGWSVSEGAPALTSPEAGTAPERKQGRSTAMLGSGESLPGLQDKCPRRSPQPQDQARGAWIYKGISVIFFVIESFEFKF